MSSAEAQQRAEPEPKPAAAVAIQHDDRPSSPISSVEEPTTPPQDAHAYHAPFARFLQRQAAGKRPLATSQSLEDAAAAAANEKRSARPRAFSATQERPSRQFSLPLPLPLYAPGSPPVVSPPTRAESDPPTPYSHPSPKARSVTAPAASTDFSPSTPNSVGAMTPPMYPHRRSGWFFAKFAKEQPGSPLPMPTEAQPPLAPMPIHRKGDVVCISYSSLDDRQMRRLEGRSDHRPVIGQYALFL